MGNVGKLVVLVGVVAHVSLAQQPPETMTKMEVVLEGPDIPAGSFATKPRVMYRAGGRYCRIEEAADPEKGIQGLAIVSEPDYWMVNLLSKTAKHAVDPGPSLTCHLPIFADADKISSLDLNWSTSSLRKPSRSKVSFFKLNQRLCIRLKLGVRNWVDSPMEHRSARWLCRAFEETRAKSIGSKGTAIFHSARRFSQSRQV
jgi:hypothetical protein